MSERFSDFLDLRQLGPMPYDINPHRYADPAETQRLIDACREDDRRGDRDVAAFELRQHGVAWVDDAAPAEPSQFAIGWLWGFGTAALVALIAVMVVGEPLLRMVMMGGPK